MIYEDNDVKDFEESPLQKPLIRSTLIAILVAMFLGVTLGFVLGYKVRTLNHHCEVAAKHAIGYTVLSSTSVKTCCGDVVTYNWKATRKEIKRKNNYAKRKVTPKPKAI